MSDYTRISITIPKDTKAALDRISRRLGLSKSACLTRLVSPALNDLDALFSKVPEEPSLEQLHDAQQFSNKLVLDRLKKYMDEL